MKALLKPVLWGVSALGLAILLVIAWMPSPVRVDTARATQGPLYVTVDEEGETRVRDRFVVATPIAGRLERIELQEGDAVARHQGLARIHPLPLDPRTRAEASARVQAAEALQREAEARVAHARADYEQARRDLDRAEQLWQDRLIPLQALEQAKTLEHTGANELAAAQFKAQAAASEVQVAKAALIALEMEGGEATRLVKLRAPAPGAVLRILEKSERVVAAGTPLLMLGDPAKLEVVIDVLSTDAVKIKPGTPVMLEDWGGEQPIRARVRVVEPFAFTKVSALGIEEQRVNIVADFVDRPGPLGDGYRVEARIIIWESESVLKVPASALFRHGQDWSVFIVEGGRARRRSVAVGHRTAWETEIVQGIDEGMEVILHPTNQIGDDMRVRK